MGSPDAFAVGTCHVEVDRPTLVASGHGSSRAAAATNAGGSFVRVGANYYRQGKLSRGEPGLLMLAGPQNLTRRVSLPVEQAMNAIHA